MIRIINYNNYKIEIWRVKISFHALKTDVCCLMCIKILIIDDNLADCKKLSTQLKNWACRANCHLKIDIKHDISIGNCLKKIINEYDILFLEIALSSLNGMELARFIRRYNKQISIVFYTNHSEFAVSGYDVQAMYFIVKPCTQTKIDNCMNQLDKNKLKFQSQKIMIQTKQIDIYEDRDIVYLEAAGHYTKLHTLTDCIKYHLPFKKINDLLPKPPFFHCYRSYTVNLNYVCGVKNKEIILIDNQKVLLSKKRMKELNNSLLQLHRRSIT